MIENTLGRLENMVGLAKKVGDDVSLIILKSHNSGGLVQQFNNITERKCKRILFIKKCHNESRSVPRGFNSNEIK